MVNNEEFISRVFAGRAFALLDCAMGTSLMAAGAVSPGGRTDRASLDFPDAVADVHRRCIRAGARIFKANTFNAGLLKADTAKDGYDAEEAWRAGLRIARRVADEEAEGGSAPRALVALDIGPLGEIVGFTDGLDHARARELFARLARVGAEEGADLVFIETMSDLEELKDAVWAAQNETALPVLCSMTFDASGHSFMGATPAQFGEEARGLGVAAIGMNCSIGPLDMARILPELLAAAGDLPVFAKPNAGQPRAENGTTVYDMTPARFAEEMKDVLALGVRMAGGCCGTTPEMVEALGKLAGKEQ
ncbi:MAG: homocysteine S-methyltransferase family protein [Clostridiales Family XIII bacterium]|jgi:5-methyltetrahydrofolate--homocysteine methyltransferase|nr:homocysteine S-methyltransferase family protein [Clostridiales Family XIII bacterium]